MKLKKLNKTRKKLYDLLNSQNNNQKINSSEMYKLSLELDDLILSWYEEREVCK